MSSQEALSAVGGKRAVKMALARGFSALPRGSRASLSVLMYHSVGNGCVQSLAAECFDAQLAALSRINGLYPLDWRRKAEWVGGSGAYLVTFDDGYVDNVEVALPVLERRGVKGVFFLTTAFLERTLDITSGFRSYQGLQPMSWDDAARLLRSGHSLGLHSHTHRNFGSLSAAEAVDEIGESVKIFRQRLGMVPDCFAYPFGQYQHRRSDLLQLMVDYDIRYIFTTDHKTANLNSVVGAKTPVLIPRLRVDADDSAQVVVQKTLGSWNYVNVMQRAKACLALRSLSPVLAPDR